jgi:hypothetical protein
MERHCISGLFTPGCCLARNPLFDEPRGNVAWSNGRNEAPLVTSLSIVNFPFGGFKSPASGPTHKMRLPNQDVVGISAAV